MESGARSLFRPDEDATLGDQVRAAKKEFWQYSSFQNSPETAIFAFGFYFAAFDSRGSLCWAGPGFDTTSGGDSWIYCWQTPFDSIPAPYFEGMREAWDIRRVIETCKKKHMGDQESLKLLNAILQEAVTSRGKGGRDTVYDFWAVVDNIKKLEQWRARLMELLLRNGK